MTIPTWLIGSATSWSDFFDRLWESGAKYLCLMLCTMGISWLLTPFFREIAKRVGMIDKPDPRRINKKPIPRGGGLAIVLSVNLVFWIYVLFSHGAPLTPLFTLPWLKTYLYGTLILSIIGLVDDYRGIPAPVKLAGQILVATIFFFSGIHWGHFIFELPGWLNYLVTVFWIVGAINAFNLIDGLDGLATGLAIIAASGLAGVLLFQNRAAETLPYLVFLGGCIGFLRYNFNPASVFLGDTGSMFLGMTLATLPLISGTRNELIVSLGMPFLVMGIPIFDTSLAIWRRAVRAFLPHAILTKDQGGGALMQPDKDHLHHRLLRVLTNNQKKVALTLYAVSALIVTIGVCASFMKGRGTGLFLIAFVALIYVVVHHFDCVEIWDTGRLLSRLPTTSRLSRFLVPVMIAIDLLVLITCWGGCHFFIVGSVPTRSDILMGLPTFVFPVFVSLVLGKIYQRVWARARVRDFIALGFAIWAGTVIGVGLFWLFRGHHTSLVRFAVLYTMVTIFILGGIRSWREVMHGVMDLIERHVISGKNMRSRILVYGGGMTLRGFLRERIDQETENRRMVVGIIDDDLLLKGRFIAGFPVFGGLEVLERTIQEYHVDAVVITCVMKPEHQKNIVAFLKPLNIPVSVWHSEETSLLRIPGSARSSVEE